MGIAIITVSLFSYPAICELKLVICYDLFGAAVRMGIKQGKHSAGFFFIIGETQSRKVLRGVNIFTSKRLNKCKVSLQNRAVYYYHNSGF